MGIGIVIIFWIIVLIFISLIIALFIKKNSLSNAFFKTLSTFIIFFISFLILNKVGNHFIGKSSGSFGDSGYYEILNGYTFEWIDNLDNGELTDGNKTIAINSKSFSESFTFIVKDNLLIIKKSIRPNQVLVIDTIKQIEDFKPKKWLLANNILENNFKTLYEFLEEESEEVGNMLPTLLAFLIAILMAYIFNKRYEKEDMK